MRIPTLDPSLSVYQLVNRTYDQKTMLSDVRTMRAISYEIENAVILDGVPARIFAGFQTISAFLPQQDRYREIAQVAESVYVFAHMDVPPPPIAYVRYIALEPGSQMANEWFLIAESQHFFTALVTNEVSNAGQHGARGDMRRAFEGVWSFDEDMVGVVQSWLSGAVRVPALPEYTEDGSRDYRQHASTMANMMNRMTLRMARMMEQLAAGSKRVAASGASPDLLPARRVLSDGDGLGTLMNS